MLYYYSYNYGLREKIIMSLTTTVKKEILYLLQDEKPHSATEIKSSVRAKYPDKNISEGVFANALRTMTQSRLCMNPERGVYIIGELPINGMFSRKNLKIQQNASCLEISEKMSQITTQMKHRFNNTIKNVNISTDDEATLYYIIKVREAIDKLEKEVTY